MAEKSRLDPKIFEELRAAGATENPLKVLMAFYERFGSLTEGDLREIADSTRVPVAQLFGVGTFYKMLDRGKKGTEIRVCTGVSCYLAGSNALIEASLTNPPSHDQFHAEPWICLGCCSWGPAAESSGNVLTGLDAATAVSRFVERREPPSRPDPSFAIEETSRIASIGHHLEILRRASRSPRIAVCTAASCLAAGSRDVIEELHARSVDDSRCLAHECGCLGACSEGPLVIVNREVMRWPSVSEQLNSTRFEAQFVIGPSFRDDERDRFYRELEFERLQQRLLTRNAGKIDPDSLNDYIRESGYSGLDKTLKLTPSQVIAEVKISGLRGRGGAGFPTGLKWEFCAKETRTPKYVICNANEGDPGSYMDRYLMESDPHQVIEGLMISAYAVGAEKGFIYLREDFRVARARLERAIAQLKQAGLLGKNILGSSFNFDVEVFVAPHAYVCGEEYALMASIEGKRGEPRPRPPYPAQSGLWGQPTNVNNVKTLCYATIILDKGGEWFAKTGTGATGGKSTGTFLIGLSGDVKRGGLVEVPMGTPIRDVVYRIGGGTKSGLKVKGVHLDGPSGGTIPESMFDLALDYESFQKVGWALGAGAMSVVNEKHCIVRLLQYLMGFMHEESCGRCFPCREGTKHMERALERMTKFEATEEDVKTLDLLSSVIQDTSICGLGITAPVPLLTAKKYFPEELAAHLKGECPAGRCKKTG